MDGRAKWAEILRRARAERSLTQRELARAAGVPQPTIAEIESGRREPSLSLVSKILESVGLEVRIDLNAVDRYSAVSVAHRARVVIHESQNVGDTIQLDDQLLRIMLSFRDALRKVNRSELHRLTSEPPSLIGDPRWDAFLAAIVEDECASRQTSSPRWVDTPMRVLKPFWYLSANPRLHDWEFETAPAAFVRHGILAAADELESV